jgi:nucleotide-binding universal stress UspA family protein
MNPVPRSVVTLNRVLCPTDFSDFSAAAATYAAALAATYRATLRLLHVTTPFPIVAPFLDVPGDPRLFETQREQADRALNAEAARLRSASVTVDTEVRDGSSVAEILAAARDFDADVIVLGTHGRGGFERLVMGSVTEKVLRKSACAVLTVPCGVIGREPGAVRWERILCAHDGSAASQHGVDYAVSLAERTGARLFLLGVVESVPYGGDFTSPEYSAFRKERERHAVIALDLALEPGVRSRLRVDDRVVYGKPSQQILQVAAQEQPDLIVMGIHGRGALDLLMFGSTTNHVVRHAEQPVLTVRRMATGA